MFAIDDVAELQLIVNVHDNEWVNMTVMEFTSVDVRRGMDNVGIFASSSALFKPITMTQ